METCLVNKYPSSMYLKFWTRQETYVNRSIYQCRCGPSLAVPVRISPGGWTGFEGTSWHPSCPARRRQGGQVPPAARSPLGDRSGGFLLLKGPVFSASSWLSIVLWWGVTGRTSLCWPFGWKLPHSPYCLDQHFWARELEQFVHRQETLWRKKCIFKKTGWVWAVILAHIHGRGSHMPAPQQDQEQSWWRGSAALVYRHKSGLSAVTDGWWNTAPVQTLSSSR